MPLRIQTGGLTGLRRVRRVSRRDRLRCRPHTLEPAARAKIVIPGKKIRNFINYDFVKYAAGVKDLNPENRQTQIAKWVAVAARCAYPWENAPSYDAEIPIEIEGATVEARRNDPVGFLPISDWCALLVPPE